MRSNKTLFIITALLIFSALSVCTAKDKPWVAVHDFSISPELSKEGIKGWDIAGKLENELVQVGKFRLVIREKIGKVLKEKNVSSSSSLAPSDFGKMVGAEYIITGNLSKSGNKLILIGKLVDVTKDTGEVERSFDLVTVDESTSELLSNLPEMLELLARKLCMSPGEYLDNGIRYMSKGQYSKAVESFKIAKTLVPINRIKELMEDPTIKLDKSLPLSKYTTPGELLDYGILMLNENKRAKAFTIFRSFEKVNPFEQIKQLFEIGKLEKEAKKLNREQREKLTNKIKEAENFIISVKESVSIPDSKIPEDKLCEIIIKNLNIILRNPKIDLSYDEKAQISKLIFQLKDIKPYIIVERKNPIIAILPFTMDGAIKSKNVTMKTIYEEFALNLTTNIEDYLASSRKFEIISNEEVSNILTKDKYNQADISNTKDEYKIGAKLSADYMITGYIKKDSLIMKPRNIELTTDKRVYVAAKLTYIYRILDIRRKKIVYSNSIKKYLTSRHARRDISGQELKSWTVLEYVNYFTSKVAPEIGDTVMESIFPAKVSSVGKEYIVINKGKSSNIKMGQIFCVFNPGEKVIDPNTGDYLGDSINEAGTVKITSIHSMYSRAEIIETKSEIKKGAVCINSRLIGNGAQSGFKKNIRKVGNATKDFFSSTASEVGSWFN